MQVQTIEETSKDLQNGQRPGHHAIHSPLVDIYENDVELLVLAELPGVSSGSLELQIHGNQLSIEGQRELALSESKDVFRRTIQLGDHHFELDRIDARLEQGVLRVHLPKSQQSLTRKIPIASG